MKLHFFTLGGKQFWEDLFFYQGWRIQRNIFTRKCRLLDAWDIRRDSGTLLHCQNSFIHYIEVYQLLKPKQKSVVMLHSLGWSKDCFNRMAERFTANDYTVIAINYPSFFRDFNATIYQLEFLLKNLKDVQEVNFVACGIGGLLARKILSKSANWRKKIKLGRVVTINTPNRGWTGGERLAQNNLISRICPNLKIYESDTMEELPDFPHNLEVGILTTWNPVSKALISILPRRWRQFFITAQDSHINGAKEITAVKSYHYNPCTTKNVITCCINFIKSGKFHLAQKIKKL